MANIDIVPISGYDIVLDGLKDKHEATGLKNVEVVGGRLNTYWDEVI